MFDNDFIDHLPEDLQLAGKMMCDRVAEVHRSFGTDLGVIEHYNDYLRALAIFQAYAESHGFELEYPVLSGPGEIDNIKIIIRFFQGVRNDFDSQYTRMTTDVYREKFAKKYGKTFLYEFSDSDIEKIQTLINELRAIIAESEQIEVDHQVRLLNRLEKLQTELHKRVSDLDRFWGLIGDAGVVLGKFGKDAKPIVDRIKEIAEIVWRVQTAAEGLPSGLPLQLPISKESEEE